jgi:TolC family type I secretion outer membrane protein
MTRNFRAVMLALLATTMISSAHAQQATQAAPTPEPPAMAPRLAIDPSAPETQAAPIAKAQQNLSDALRWSYDNNPTINAARAELLATQERLPQALAGWKPSAEASTSVRKTWVDGSGNNDGSTEKTVGLEASQPLYRGGRTVAQTASAKNAIMAQRAFLMATEQGTLLQVVTAYMNVIRDQSLYDLAVNNKDVIGRQLEATNARFEVGDVTRTDVSQSQARFSQAEATRVNALGALRSSMAIYQRVTGLPPATLSTPQISLPIPATMDAAIEMAENYNPSVLAADFLHRSAKEDIDTVFGELLPEVGLFGAYNHTIDPSPGNADDSTVSAIGVSATMPLYRGGATQSRVRQTKSTAQQRMIQVEEAQRLARQQTASSWESLLASQAEILSRRAQVEASRIARDGVHKEAELGTRTILDALDADQELLDAESALVTAQRNEVVARFTLATTLGLMTPETLGFPELARDYNIHIDEINGKIFSNSTEFGKDIGQQPGKVTR